MNFIYFWRLAREKGFDLIVRSLSDIVDKTGKLPGNISIFGEGDLCEMLFESFGESPFFEDCSCLTEEEMEERIASLGDSEWEEEKKIYFFGWQSQGTIRNVLQTSHFSLMPSRFLETFGLSALESLSEGVPVIGFRKWGLIPFIDEKLSLRFSENDHENTEDLAEKLLEVSEKYSPLSSERRGAQGEAEDNENWKILSNEVRYIADSYTEGRWMKQVRSILPERTKKILLVSDYTTILGGIETHVQTIAKALRHEGYEVETFGWDIGKGRITKFQRLMGLVYSLCNITSALVLRRKIREFKPDTIWLHSVSRFLGPLAVREVNRSGIFSLVTHHDLGVLSPFPSRVESEEMVPKTPSLLSFVATVRSGNPIVHLAIYCKYLQVFVLRKLFWGISIHIVPSFFLVQHIHEVMEIPEEKIVVLEHFL